MCEGEEVRAAWFNRRAWQTAGEPEDREPFMKPVRVRFTPLSRWANRPRHEWQRVCRALREDIAQEYAGLDFIGVEAALARGPQYRPLKLKYSRSYVYEANGPERKEILKAAYRKRAERLRAHRALVRRIIQAGHSLLRRAQQACRPDCHDWTPLMADALEDRPIADAFFATWGESAAPPALPA